MNFKKLFKELGMIAMFNLAGVAAYFYLMTGVGVIWILGMVFNAFGYLIYKDLINEAKEEGPDEQAKV